jgi:hypothetical protein
MQRLASLTQRLRRRVVSDYLQNNFTEKSSQTSSLILLPVTRRCSSALNLLRPSIVYIVASVERVHLSELAGGLKDSSKRDTWYSKTSKGAPPSTCTNNLPVSSKQSSLPSA